MKVKDLVGKTLMAKKDGFMQHNGKQFCTKGGSYPIKEVSKGVVKISSDLAPTHYFDMEDLKIWFYIKEGAFTQKTPLYNPVKNISQSKYNRCVGNETVMFGSNNGVFCVMHTSDCGKYYYWREYNIKGKPIYFRGEVGWVKDNYKPYIELLKKNVSEMHKSLEQLTLENEDSEEKVVVMKEKSTGGKSDYYKIILPEWLVDKQQENGYIMLEDLAEVIFGNDFNFTNIFKAQKRMYEMTKGGGKEGNTFEYDATKCKYYVDKQLEIAKRGV